MKINDWPIYRFTGSTTRILSTFGIYVVTGSGASPIFTIPSPASTLNAGGTPPVYFIHNEGTGTITMSATNGGTFSINNVATSPYTIGPGKSAIIYWNGAFYDDLLGNPVSSTIRNTPTTGGTVVLTNVLVDLYTLVLTPAGTIATLTVTLPTATPRDGQRITVTTTQDITAITFNGPTLSGAPTTLLANTFVTFVYQSTTTTWYRVG